MKPVKFKQCNTNFAEHQDEYQTLPAHVDYIHPEGTVTSCWQLTWKERFIVLFRGQLWLQQLTFHNHVLQPQLILVKNPLVYKIDTSNVVPLRRKG